MNIINPYTVMISFAVILALLVYFRPAIGRIVTGIFFLVMAFGVNIPMAIIDPGLFAAAGANALLPVYHWFFGLILAQYPLPFVILLILFEATIGVMILSRGWTVHLGLIGACLFCLFLTPVGMEEITSPLLIIPFGMLLFSLHSRQTRAATTSS
jgi:hypothetical protein